MSLDPIAVPIVMKAVDFLFGEAKKILEERRQARQKPDRPVAPPPDIPLLEQDKETVLKRQVSKELVKREEQAIQGILDEAAVYQQNLQRLQKRVALEGGIDYAPIGVVNQLHAQEDALLEASQRLAVVIERVES